jgi:hypothetical protein
MVASLLSVVLLSGCPATSGVKPDRRASQSYSAAPVQQPPAESATPLSVLEADRAISAVETGHDAFRSIDPAQNQCPDCVTHDAIPKAIPVEDEPASFSGAANSFVDEASLFELVDQAFRDDPGCQKVFTGNGGLYHELNAKEIGYPRTLARAFAEEVCSPIDPVTQQILSAAPGHPGSDAIARPAFKQYLAVSDRDGDLVNSAATYSMLYSQGLRESDGNFQLGKDESGGNNTPLTEEAGAFQVSSNTLDGSDAGTQARRKIMARYLDRLADAHSRHDLAGMSSICGIRDAGELPSGNRSKDKNEQWLATTFESGARCGLLQEKLRTNGQALSRNSRERGTCFIELQKHCPVFAVRYNAVAIRTRADHFGPLKIRKLSTQKRGVFSKSEADLERESREQGRIWEGYRNVKNGKNPPRPECRKIFDVVLENRNRVCFAKALPVGDDDEVPSPKQWGAVPVTAGAPLSVTSAAAAISSRPEDKQPSAITGSKPSAAGQKPSPGDDPFVDVPRTRNSVRELETERALPFLARPADGKPLSYKPGEVRPIEQLTFRGPIRGTVKQDLVFGDARKGVEPIRMRMVLPDVECPVEFSQGPGVCFHSEPNSKQSIVLDPGHADQELDSLRNAFHDEVHEGQANMAVSLMARQLILKCAPYDPRTGRGVQVDAVRMTHYPGETGYGDFEQGYLARRKGLLSRWVPGNKDIQSTGGTHLMKQINTLMKYRDPDMNDSVMVSIHADGPDVYSAKARMDQERPLVLASAKRDALPLGAVLSEKLFDYSRPFYSKEQLNRLAPANTLHVEGTARAAVMLAGASRTEAVLMEGFHMDGKVVGEGIQRELHDCRLNERLQPILRPDGSCVRNPIPSEVIQAQVFDPKEKKWVDVKWRKAEITRQKRYKSGAVEMVSASTREGPELRGLKVSKFYKAYAQSIAAGIAQRYACPGSGQ